MFACAACGVMFAPTTVRMQQRDEKPAVVRISGQAISIRQCIKPLDEKRQQEVSELSYRLKLTNISSRPIIIYRYTPNAYDARLSTTLAGIQHAKFHFDERPSFSPMPTRTFQDPEPGNQSFRVLVPNQSYTYEYPEIVTFLPTELIDADKKVFVGEFFIQLKVTTWLSTTEEAEKLQHRWAKYGQFFYQDVTTEPFSFTVEKAGPATARCNVSIN